MSMTKKIFLLFLVFFNPIHAQFLKENVLRLTRFLGHCEGKENLPMRLYNISVQNLGKKVVVNCKIIIERDVDHDLSVLFSLQRCKNKDDLDTCQKYQDLKFPKTCGLINAKKQFWTPFVERIQPRIECPFRKGMYVVKNATFDAGNIFLPVYGWYWKTTLNVFNTRTKDNISCMYVEGEIKQKGVKKN